MEARDFQEKAARTINSNLYDYEIEQHALHGMASEIGELHGLYQKAYQGHEFDEEHAQKELGDLLWFVAEYCTAMNWDLGLIMILSYIFADFVITVLKSTSLINCIP